MGSHPVSMTDFSRYYDQLLANDQQRLTEEFESIRASDQRYPAEEAEKGENFAKNRFVNILPFDKTRVQLKTADGIDESDYINANYIAVSEHF